jgi:hypothetical protein
MAAWERIVVAKFRLINVRSANLIGSYDDEDDALKDIADGIRHHHGKLDAAKNLALQRTHPGYPDEPLDEGIGLAERALERFPHPDQNRLRA